MRYLTVEEILRLHFEIIESYGGSHGVRDEGRLKSVEVAPSQQVFGIEQYPTVFEKAAVYMRNIIGDHSFSDGNKRSGITVASVFLDLNGLTMSATPRELEDFAVYVATTNPDIPEIASWLEERVA